MHRYMIDAKGKTTIAAVTSFAAFELSAAF